ncbi:phosphatidate cytidylyltransferase [candidate division KSB1 bacterium]|nr:phosphatidate cytidylyltransferase [candidate division KSB1 bacterium]RQW00699.1 MAG: phosphatidate cytidylyltransferase [candidate division KSB1 bacterium]
MSRGDILGLIFSYVYAFALLFIVEAIGKKFHISQNVTRKIIHIGAGLWVWPILFLFDHWYFGIIPFATFIALNYIFYKKHSFEQMDASQSTLGTVYFAFSITLLFAAFWRTDSLIDRAPIAIAATMAMTLGDAFAALLGQRFGRHYFHIFGNTKSSVGSSAMFVFSFLGIFLSLVFLSGSVWSPASAVLSLQTAVTFSLLTALVATVAEAVSPVGTDNLSVPLLSGLVLFLLIS